MITELQAAREVIHAMKLDDKKEKSFFVHERIFYYDKIIGEKRGGDELQV